MPSMTTKVFAGSVKGVNEETRTVRFVITTGGVDRDNDTIDPKGWEIDEFLRSPSVLWAHDYVQPPIARALDVTRTSDGLTSTAQFPPKGVHPFADTVFDLIKLGIVNSSSVGFKPLEFTHDQQRGGTNFLRQLLLEWSVVPVAANAQALVMRSGRRNSAKDQALLDTIHRCVRELGSACDGTEPPADEPPDAERSLAALVREVDDDDEFDVSPQEIAAAVAAALPGLLKEELVAAIKAETARALARARGRIVDGDPLFGHHVRRFQNGFAEYE